MLQLVRQNSLYWWGILWYKDQYNRSCPTLPAYKVLQKSLQETPSSLYGNSSVKNKSHLLYYFYYTHGKKVLRNTNQRLSRACIVHLVIKRTNWSYVKTMSCSGSHLGITINIKNTKFVKELPMIDAQFRFNQCNSFREEYISVFSPYGPMLILWPVVAAILDFRSA